jgi:hypothetical protein
MDLPLLLEIFIKISGNWPGCTLTCLDCCSPFECTWERTEPSRPKLLKAAMWGGAGTRVFKQSSQLDFPTLMQVLCSLQQSLPTGREQNLGEGKTMQPMLISLYNCLEDAA